MSVTRLLLAVLTAGVLVNPSPAQFGSSAAMSRTAPEMLKLFEPVVAKASASVVKVKVDNKTVAYGTVVFADGFIVTKYSEVEDADVITVTLPGGGDATASLVGIQLPYDLALLKVEAKNLTPVEWQKSDAVHLGSWLATAGPTNMPAGLGVVSVMSRKMPGPYGPIFRPNAASGFLGVGASRGGSDDGILKLGMVTPETAADKAGLKVNDIILTINGRELKDWLSLQSMLARTKPGDEIKVKYKRDGEEKEAVVKLGKRPNEANRSEFQNNMGGELSKRRDGFPVVLQHDTFLKPAEVGSPVVSLNGKAVGINIARAGRPQTLVLPSEVLEPILAEMKAGKLAPPALTSKMKDRMFDLENLLRAAKENRDEAKTKLDESAKKIAELEAELKVLQEKANKK